MGDHRRRPTGSAEEDRSLEGRVERVEFPVDQAMEWDWHSHSPRQGVKPAQEPGIADPRGV